MFSRPSSGFRRQPTGQSRGRFGRPAGRRGGRKRGDEVDPFDPFTAMTAMNGMAGRGAGPRQSPAGLVARAAARRYARWVMAAPDTRGLGTGLAALYPVGEIAHHYAAADAVLLGAFAPPAALAAWVATYKTHGSPRYSGALAALAAGPPVWLATAATTGITNLSTLLAYTVTATGLWSSYTWSDVLKQRRRAAELQARWETIAGLSGLEGTRLVRTQTTRIGVRFKVDLGVDGPSAGRLARGDLAEQIARCYGIGTGQVRIEASGKNARIMWITIQLLDLWADVVPHPAVVAADGAPVPPETAAAGKGSRSVLDGPFIIGTDPETGADLELTVFDSGGARHVDIIASNGGGKTNLLSNIVQQAAECRDVLTVAIDLGKGVITTLWNGHLHEAAGVGEEDKALAILDWIDALLKERTIEVGGGTLKPAPDSPVVLVQVDEQDTATGFDSAVAASFKPVMDQIHRRGRSLGVALITAKQRDVVQHTGSKEGKANAYTTIVGRVANTKEMSKALPGWEALGCPDMSTYGGDTEGVALLVRQGGAWTAGRTRALFDPDTVTALANAYGPATAHLEPRIAAALPGGYAQRHPIPAHAHATSPSDRIDAGPAGSSGTARGTGGPAPSGPPSDPGTGAGETPAARPHGGPDAPAADRGRAAAGWGFDTGDDAAVDKAAKNLVERLDEFIAETAEPPDHPTSLEDLNAAKKRIDNTTVPEHIAQAITGLLAQRGPRGARRDEVVEHLKMARSTVSEHLGGLIRDGLITRAGNGKASRYYLPDHTPDDHTT